MTEQEVWNVQACPKCHHLGNPPACVHVVIGPPMKLVPLSRALTAESRVQELEGERHRAQIEAEHAQGVVEMWEGELRHQAEIDEDEELEAEEVIARMVEAKQVAESRLARVEEAVQPLLKAIEALQGHVCDPHPRFGVGCRVERRIVDAADQITLLLTPSTPPSQED